MNFIEDDTVISGVLVVTILVIVAFCCALYIHSDSTTSDGTTSDRTLACSKRGLVYYVDHGTNSKSEFCQDKEGRLYAIFPKEVP